MENQVFNIPLIEEIKRSTPEWLESPEFDHVIIVDPGLAFDIHAPNFIQEYNKPITRVEFIRLLSLSKFVTNNHNYGKITE